MQNRGPKLSEMGEPEKASEERRKTSKIMKRGSVKLYTNSVILFTSCLTSDIIDTGSSGEQNR